MQRGIYDLHNKTAPFIRQFRKFSRHKDFKFWMYTFHRMTVNFLVRSPVCYIFHFKVVAFCQNIGKSVILAGKVPISSFKLVA